MGHVSLLCIWFLQWLMQLLKTHCAMQWQHMLGLYLHSFLLPQQQSIHATYIKYGSWNACWIPHHLSWKWWCNDIVKTQQNGFFVKFTKNVWRWTTFLIVESTYVGHTRIFLSFFIFVAFLNSLGQKRSTLHEKRNKACWEVCCVQLSSGFF